MGSHWPLGAELAKYPRSRCEYRAQPLVHGANTNHVTVPMEWPHEDYPVSARTPPTDFNEEDFLELHRICALEKFVPITKALLQSAFQSIVISLVCSC